MPDNYQPLFYAGTSGLVLPVPNKLHYPEEFREKSRLCYYASLFNTIEVNSSFYKVPMGKTVARWSESVPENFRFTYKLWKGITHNKQLSFEPDDVRHFMQVISHAGNKKGCLLVQFPASITADYEKPFKSLLQLIRKIDQHAEWKLSVEFRHISWYTDKMYDWLHKRSIAIVYHDIAPVPPFIDSFNNWSYLRFHGPEKGYRGSYSNQTLAHYASEVNSFVQNGKTVFAYFNNTLGDPVNNLITLRSFINL